MGRLETLLATWRPAGRVIRVVILEAEDDSWRASPCTDRDAGIESIAQAAHDRWAIEANDRDPRRLERVGEVQLRRAWPKAGAFHPGMWVHTSTES